MAFYSARSIVFARDLLNHSHKTQTWTFQIESSGRRVSRAILSRFFSGMCSSVRMLWRRSASFTMMMRKSSVMAMNICRRFSA